MCQYDGKHAGDLDWAIACNELVLHVTVPQAEFCQVFQQMMIHNLNNTQHKIIRR